MKTLMTYYGRNLKSKVKVVPHTWARGVVVLLLYRSRKWLWFRTWKMVDTVGIEWPENEVIMKGRVDELLNKIRNHE